MARSVLTASATGPATSWIDPALVVETPGPVGADSFGSPNRRPWSAERGRTGGSSSGEVSSRSTAAPARGAARRPPLR
jgi:hypothetical protein